MIKVGIFGVTGYAGYELLRWLRRHREVQVVFTTSESQAGKSLAAVFPGPLDTPLIAPDDAPLGDVDVVFLGLPHGVAASVLLPAPYGLPELNRAALRDAPLIANPGCYPTSVLLGPAPLLRAGALA